MPTIGVYDPDKLKELLQAVLLIESDLSLPVVLRRVVKAACALTDAKYGAIGVLDSSGEKLSEFITEGLSDEEIRLIGNKPVGRGILGALITDAVPLRTANLPGHEKSYGFPLHHPKMSTFLGVPIKVSGTVFGNIYLTEKEQGQEFTNGDEEIVISLAQAAGIAIENARLHSRVRELTLTEDRARIARDLHDEVIQRIFAVGLSLQSMTRLIDSDQVRGRLQDSIDELDETIKQIRTTIFALETTQRLGQSSARSKILTVVSEAVQPLGFEPMVTFTGPIDAFVEEPVLSNLLSVLREALSNIARHAQATRVDINISATQTLILKVEDDGVGLKTDGRVGMGIKNMRDRARQLGGDLNFNISRLGGVQLLWTADL
jgi:signal transduction histidine kinase